MKNLNLTFLALSMVITASLHADITDFLRPEERREDYTKNAQQSGLLHETYTDKEGNVHRRFAPIEGIFGVHRGHHEKQGNIKTDATDYKKTTRSGKLATPAYDDTTENQ